MATIDERISEIEAAVVAMARAEFGNVELTEEELDVLEMMIEEFRQTPARDRDPAIRWGRNAYRSRNQKPRQVAPGKRNGASRGMRAGAEEFGDSPGHPFRGNQHTDGGGGSKTDDGDGFAEAKKPDSPAQAELRTQIKDAPISDIATVIRNDWKNPNYAAVPYLDAMRDLKSVKDNYGADSGKEIVSYFISNARSWSGETAAVVKDELRRQVK